MLLIWRLPLTQSCAICSPELLMCCLADRLGGVRAGANGQRSHLRHHPGILCGLRLQRRLQLAAVVKECVGGGGRRRGGGGVVGWEPLVGPVFTSVTTYGITVWFLSLLFIWWAPVHRLTPNQCNIFFSFLPPASCWTDSNADGKCWGALKLDSTLTLLSVLPNLFVPLPYR